MDPEGSIIGSESEFEGFDDDGWEPLEPPPKGWYDSPAAVKDAINTFALDKGYAAVTRRSKVNKKSEVRKVWIRCDKGTKYETRSSGRRNASTRRTDCPFKCIAQLHCDPPVDVLGDHWHLTVEDARHNHGFVGAFAHPVQRRKALNKQRRTIKSECERNVPTKAIVTGLRMSEGTPMVKARDVWNLRSQFRREELDGLTPERSSVNAAPRR